MGETSVPETPDRDGVPHPADVSPASLDAAREKVARVFRYLLEMHRIKTPPIVHSDQYEWSLDLGQVVHHPGIERGEVGHDDHGRGIVLEVGRPEESECPRPSVVFEKWLKAGWDDPAKEPAVHQSRKLETGGAGKVEEAFDDSEARVEAFEEWLDSSGATCLRTHSRGHRPPQQEHHRSLTSRRRCRA